MQKYAKLIEGALNYAPQNKGSVLNYDTNVDLMLADGYKPFYTEPIPLTNRRYHVDYEETEDALREVIVYEETQEEADAREAQERQEKFYNNFFEIPEENNVICYRKIPKGYSSAVESINTTLNMVNLLGNLPANTLVFYPKPDFTIPEQCTEEWLVEHQTKNEVMTKEEFMGFYSRFIIAWNNQEHL